MPNYRKKSNNNNNNRNKNKNKNKSTTASSSVKEETRIVESTTTTTTTTSSSSGIEPNLPANNVRNSFCITASAKNSTFEEKNIVVIVNDDEDSNISPQSNEEIDENASNVDIDTVSVCEDTNSILKQSSFYSSSTSSSSSSSSSSSYLKKSSTEIEDRQSNRAVFDIGDSSLVDSVIKESFVKDISSNKNSLKTGSANAKHATAPPLSGADLPTAKSIDPQLTDHNKRISRESVSEKMRENLSEQRSKSTEIATEVIESSNESRKCSSKQDHSSKVIVHKVIIKNDLPTLSTRSDDPSRVIVHQISKEDDLRPQVIVRHEETSSSTSSQRASKNGVDLSKKTSTKAAESSTTQTLSFSNVSSQPSRSIIDNSSRNQEPSKTIVHQISKEEDNTSKVIVHQISREEKQQTPSSSSQFVNFKEQSLPQTTEYKSILHQISPSPKSPEVHDQSGKTIIEDSFINTSDNFSKKLFSKDTSNAEQVPLRKEKVVLIPILQENATQTSPLPSYNENPLHSSLLERIKEDHNETKLINKSEKTRQMSSSPLSRSPVICFENLSKSFELNKEETTQTSVPTTPSENTSKFKEEKPPKSNSKTPHNATEHLEPLIIPSFPINRPTKIILHPIINEVSGKPVFPFSEKSLESINSSSKEIANKILREVSTELKSSLLTENSKRTIKEEIISEPVRTSFPIAVKTQTSFRPGFFETDVCQKEVNPLDIEAKVIVRKISKEEVKNNTKKSENLRSEEKVIEHQISKEKSSVYSDICNEKTKSEEELTNNGIEVDRDQQSQSKVIVHQISRVESKVSNEHNNEQPKVILHNVSKEYTPLTRSPSFPLASEIEGEFIKKDSMVSSKDSFPISMLKTNHEVQYTSKTKKLEDKSNTIAKMINHPISQSNLKATISSSPKPIHTSFPVTIEKRNYASFTSQPISKEEIKHSNSVITSSQKKEDHTTKTSEPQLSEKFEDVCQTKSTKTSSAIFTETETRKEIIHMVLEKDKSSDLQQKTTKRSTEMIESESQPKEIIHTILKEPSGSDFASQANQGPSIQQTHQKVEDPSLPKEIIHPIIKEDSTTDLSSTRLDHQTSQDESVSSSEGSVLTAIHNESPRSISPPSLEQSKPSDSAEELSPKRSLLLTPLDITNKARPQTPEEKHDQQETPKVINHAIIRQIEKPLGYRVESPQPEKLPMIVKKSKSFGDDELVIQEMSDTSSAADTDNPPLVSEAESETDTLEGDDFSELPSSSSILSVQTLPFDHESSKTTSSDYKTRKQQNRAALESHFLPQFLTPNFLDSIKEENSDLSDSDRRSSCSDRIDPPPQHGDLDDDVFHDPSKKANAVYPKSNLDFSKKHKHVLNVRPPKTSVIREEASPPSVVEAKIIDQGSIEESCSSWSTDLTPESEAAEVVYIDSASSSVSDLLELDYSQGHQPDATEPIDVRIQTPTIDLDSVNEMFATCQTNETNDRKILIPPTEKPPPPPPVNDNGEQEKINDRNLLPPHNRNDLPKTQKLKQNTQNDEIIFENKETMSESSARPSDDTQKNNFAASSISAADENSIANYSSSRGSAIEQIVTSKQSSSLFSSLLSSSSSSSFASSNTVGVGSDKSKNMEHIREIVNASASVSSPSTLPSFKSESDKITIDHEFSKPNFMIGQPCSDHTLKSDTISSSSACTSSSSSNTTTTKILTLHDLSQTLDKCTKMFNNNHPRVSFNLSSNPLEHQESLDSHNSDHSNSTNQSQCTAINLGSLPHCDWQETVDSTTDTYVSESESSINSKGDQTSSDETESQPIRKLRSLCTEALASMPYGEEILHELASVAQNIQDMPYPLPELPQIQGIQLSLNAKPEKSSTIKLSQVPPKSTAASNGGQKLKTPPPPPVPEPPSKYDSWLGVPSESDPNVLLCLSPSQRNAVKNDATADSLLDMHKKFVERRGYHEYTSKQVNAINQANTFAEIPKLNKIDSPSPPPLPPRPPIESTNSNSNGNTDKNDLNYDEEDQNRHRLLAIIRDTHESQQQHQHHLQQEISSMTSTTENISRRTESGIHHNEKISSDSRFDKEFAKTPSSVNQESQSGENSKFQSSDMHKTESEQSKMFGNETVLGMRFPTSDYFDSIFDGNNKRFSNIETGPLPTEFCSQIRATQPKRYSNIETSTFESKKFVENGNVLYDVSNSKREKIVEGDQTDSTVFPELSKPKTNGSAFPLSNSSTSNRYASGESRPQFSGDNENIMSEFKLNTTTAPSTNQQRVESSPPAPPVPPLPPTLAAQTTNSSVTTKSTSTTESSHINRTFNASTSEKTFVDDSGQCAKEAAPNNSKSNNESAASLSSSSTNKKSFDVFQHEKLLKDFDELSNLLKDELESGKRRPPATLNANDIPSSVIDYNRVAKESRIQNNHVSSTTKTTETIRREQMKKLAEEIDRTSKQKLQQRRELRIPVVIEKSTKNEPIQPQRPVSYEIPVQTETHRTSLQQPNRYEIPVQVERQSSNSSRQRTFSEHQSDKRTHEIPIQIELPSEDRSRRSKSMIDIFDATSSRHHLHHDEWIKCVGDLGSSENICKPFQREVEICYLGRRPNIRAPRMSTSTSDLSNIHTFDTYGAYDVRRTNQTPRPQQPPRRAYLSTQSLIDTTPITSCVSPRRSERRSSLPREIHDQQLKYITSQEQQLKSQIERLEREHRQLIDERNRVQRISRETYRQRQLPPLTEDESFREKMAEEWLNEVAEREERRLQNVIKISKVNQEPRAPVAPPRRHSAADGIGDEFLQRVKERRSKLCMPSDSDWESGAESQPMPRADGNRSEAEEPPVTVFEGHSITNLKQLPKHLREFAKLTSQVNEERRQEITENSSSSASKMTSMRTTIKTTNNNESQSQYQSQSETLKDAVQVQQHQQQQQQQPQLSNSGKQRTKLVTILRHKKPTQSDSESGGAGGATNCEQLLGASGSNNNTNLAIKRRKQTRFLLTPNRRSWSESDLLREIDKDLVLAKGFLYANVFSVKNEYMSEPETEYDKPKKMAQLSRRQYDGIGPTTKHGMPLVLRSEVKEPNQHEWYKRIFQTIHKQKNPDDYVTIRYKCPRGRYPYKANGYMSEPEPNYDSDYSTVKYRTLERRRLQSTGTGTGTSTGILTESRTSSIPAGNESQEETFYGTMPNPVKSGQGSYKVQPGRIENYITGHSSVSEKEKKEWWDEVMDIFNSQLDQQKLSPHYTEGNLSRALLKEQGYTSDSNLVFRKKDVPILQSPLSPVEQKQVYKSVQAGGQPPLLGFRKPAPEKPKESPNRYFESDVNIHYKTPIRYEYKDPIPEEDLAIRQAEAMQKLYQEERRRKYIQELQDTNSRRHTDHFTPSQKSPIPLNRYDDFNSDLAPKSPNPSNYPRTVARALYNFQGQTARELTFKKGDVIYIRRQIDKNWYEGEHNAMIGLLPTNYVELLTKDGIRQPPKKPSEGQARAKYNFQAQSAIELSLNKGELVTLTRRVDENWYEGKIANRKGIFPVSYVEVLIDIGAEDRAVRLPVATQSIITQSSSSMRPSLDTLRTNINNEFNSLTSNGQQPPNGILRETRTLHKTEVLHVDTNTEPIAYRALYKYRPQNTDELELQEGDIVFVLEKCDDGWFVGTSQRSGCFGTFPGNYVERV